MKHKKNIVILFIVLTYILSSCISGFETPENMKDLSGLLVVEGVILEEGTRISLSRTVKLNEEFSQNYLFEGVNNAAIHIIDENHNIIAVAEQYEWGKYIVNERFSFVSGMKYALDIQVAGKRYQSDFVQPVTTPAIDEINWKLNADNSIDISVSTHSPDNETLYCLWTFEENWEIRSRYFAPLRFNPMTDALIPQSITGDNRYYCWGKAYSQSFLLASTEKFRDAIIKDYKIHTLHPWNSRFSYLYSITVSQYSLNKEASLYFSNLQRNIDESGTLFAPQPSEIRGNIRNMFTPDEPVFGYIYASKVAQSRLFINMIEFGLDKFDESFVCTETDEFRDPRSAYFMGYRICRVDNGQYYYAYHQCVDCTERQFNSKIKPDFWPNDHQ